MMNSRYRMINIMQSGGMENSSSTSVVGYNSSSVLFNVEVLRNGKKVLYMTAIIYTCY